jgi:hypothetical protein
MLYRARGQQDTQILYKRTYIIKVKYVYSARGLSYKFAVKIRLILNVPPRCNCTNWL